MDFRQAGAAAVDAQGPAPVVVIGAGAAGIALALALEGAGRRVVLVESGGEPRDVASAEEHASLNEGEVVGAPYTGLVEGRARVIGGATQLWHGQCTKLQPLDLERRSWVPESGWPLTASDLEPWYAGAERFFSLSGAGYGAERWREHPRLHPVTWSADRLEHDFSEYTPDPHLGDVHRRHLRRSTVVTVLHHATAVAVELAHGRAVGVRLRSLQGDEAVVPAAEVVLAAGAIENARLLQLSDPAGKGLGSGREHTGRWLQDHPAIETLDINPLPGSPLQDLYSHVFRGRRRLYPKVRLAAAAQEREQLLDANAVIVHEHRTPGLDAARRLVVAARDRRPYAGSLVDGARSVRALPPLAKGAYRRWVRGLSAGAPSTSVRLQVWLEQVPERDNRVLLGDRRDILGLPVARVTWRVGEAERRTSRILSRWVAEDLERLALARPTALVAMDDDEAWSASVSDAYHPSGTTRMSSSPTDGVVGPDCGVHGVPGLSVVGSSVFPTGGYANPTLTVVALAERLAARIVQR